jgi:hypothetical protein
VNLVGSVLDLIEPFRWTFVALKVGQMEGELV